jgi:predicted TIM-barrel fold metal-dependent hydrolase
VPSYLWLMDQNWKQLRYQVPWVKRPPSEYVRENVRFCSQPLDDPQAPDGLAKILEWMDAEHTVIFSSDYPHFDWDEPQDTFKTMPEGIRRRLLWDNAAELYGVQ